MRNMQEDFRAIDKRNEEEQMSKVVAKFCAGDFSLDDAPLSGKPVEVDSDQIETLIENHQCYTTWNIADILKISKSSTENHLHHLGYVHRFDVWAPHKLSEKNLLDNISACDSLLKHNENVLFLKQIVTGDEKWILFNNVEWKKLWDKRNTPPPTPPKAGLHPKKYCSQLEQLKAALDEKHPELVNRKCIIFHQDNARLYVSLMTRQKLLQLDWEVLIHPPYSPDMRLQISIYFGLYKILLIEKISVPWKTVKGTWNSSLFKKIKSFGKMEL
ncbi:histone-lysine N-methyltransferase SETMAR-like [Lagenorhynchus albirostris]|uniref:histone-lysine N-methyltransferase SETMAR-like n=1 Tax=Lagenorhynchus albirostris TaxID=27610 RepID=UPI0028E6D464|nr:histone-lysine N-methyltransferase SETMAR-like [Lagenorhynchus albirostris]